MTKVLVTGAAGFVGRWLVRLLLAEGYEVVGAVKGGVGPAAADLADDARRAARWAAVDLEDLDSVRRLAEERCDAVVHLAAVSSGIEARRDPGRAWSVNAAGTARLLDEFGRTRRAGDTDPVVVVASTGEVYGAEGTRPFVETDPVAPCSPYAASKAGAEYAAWETRARTGLRVIVVRPFQQIGPGQDERYVAPALARRLRGAKLAGARVVKVGSLAPVRDFLDVRDVAAAIVAVLQQGTPGEVYNIATGSGVRLQSLFEQLAAIMGVDAIPEVDPELIRSADIPYLVGDACKLRCATGWKPLIPIETTLGDLVASQED